MIIVEYDIKMLLYLIQIVDNMCGNGFERRIAVPFVPNGFAMHRCRYFFLIFEFVNTFQSYEIIFYEAITAAMEYSCC